MHTRINVPIKSKKSSLQGLVPHPVHHHSTMFRQKLMYHTAQRSKEQPNATQIILFLSHAYFESIPEGRRLVF